MSAPPARRGHPEADIQREIVSALRYAVPLGGLVHACNHEVRGSSDRDRLQQSIARGMGVMPGFSDLIVMSGGRVLFLEVKTPTGYPSEAQMRFAAMVEGQGHAYAIARSPAEALDSLLLHGLKTRVKGCL